MSPDRRQGLRHIDYGYTAASAGSGLDRAVGAGYRLKDREVSDVLDRRVYTPLSRLTEGSIVLNLGAGDGNLEANVPPGRRYSFVSVDQDPKGVASIAETFAGMNGNGKKQDKAVVGDITNMASIGVQPQSVDAAVAWRVAHALPDTLHEPFFEQVHDALKPGGHFYVAVLSDEDWKRRELEERGKYRPGAVNECVDVMRFADAGIPKDTWPLYFFSEEQLDTLAEKTGFVRVGDIETFKEPSGYEHLLKDPDRKDVTYHFVDLQSLEVKGDGHLPHQGTVFTRTGVERN